MPWPKADKGSGKMVVKMTLMPLLKEAWVQQARLLVSDKGKPFSVVTDGSSYYS